MYRSVVLLSIFGLTLLGASGQPGGNLKPYEQNRAYWQHKNAPVLLLGGTRDDNLFQDGALESHLDSLKEAGGNRVREG